MIKWKLLVLNWIENVGYVERGETVNHKMSEWEN